MYGVLKNSSFSHGFNYAAVGRRVGVVGKSFRKTIYSLEKRVLREKQEDFLISLT